MERWEVHQSMMGFCLEFAFLFRMSFQNGKSLRYATYHNQWWTSFAGGTLTNEIASTTLLGENQSRLKAPKRQKSFWTRLASSQTGRLAHPRAMASLWGRCYQKARQFALIHAIAEGKENIDGSAAEWGRDLAHCLTQELVTIAETRLSRSQFERIARKF